MKLAVFYNHVLRAAEQRGLTAEQALQMVHDMGYTMLEVDLDHFDDDPALAEKLRTAGFGIANIMFVSVKERTNIIGIQKALGAKKHVILVQFLVEAVVLAIAGGVVGILLVLLVVLLLPATDGFTFSLSLANVIWGVAIASVIGVLSGILPAWKGASLNPVDAINSK